MKQEEYFYLGKITRLHGYNGKVILFLDVDDPKKYIELNIIFIQIDGIKVPFFIESSSLKGSKLVVKLQDVNNVEQAEKLVNQPVFLPLSVLPPLTGNKFYFHEVVGFNVTDKQYGLLGAIADVLDYPNQTLFSVFFKGKEVLIPVNDDVILNVDRTTKNININAPDGLIDMYLNE